MSGGPFSVGRAILHHANCGLQQHLPNISAHLHDHATLLLKLLLDSSKKKTHVRINLYFEKKERDFTDSKRKSL